MFDANGKLVVAISIHALRGEGDSRLPNMTSSGSNFNPRPPWGGRPGRGQLSQRDNGHFNPRPPWGGRRCNITAPTSDSNFNPRPPWGGRPHTGRALQRRYEKFQSTPSVGRATAEACTTAARRRKFQSTPSVGRATAKTYKYAILRLYIVHIKLYIFATAVLFT